MIGFVRRLFDPPVVVLLLVQLVGYAALSVIVAGSQFAAVFAPLRAVPTLLLVPVALLGVPAVALASVGGIVLTAAGVRPTVWLVVPAAYLCSVSVVWIGRKLSG